MAGGPLSGRFGVVNGINGIRNWSINDNMNTADFVNSATAIGTGRNGGVYQWSGGYANHGAVPPVMPGVLFGFQGFTAPDNGILGGAGMKYIGNAMVDSVNINWDWTAGQVIQNQTSFQGHLGLTPSTGAYPFNDVSISNPEPVCGTFLECSADNGTTWVRIPSLAQAGLQITNAVQAYTNADTACTTGRTPGIVDWNLNLTIQDSILGSGVLSKGSKYIFRVYSTASLFWLLKWGIVKEYTGLTVSPETGTIIQYNATISMAATNSAYATTVGQIKAPGAPSPYWGV